MEQILISLLEQALAAWRQQNDNHQVYFQPAIQLSASKGEQHGDFSTNLALILAPKLRQPPRQLAQQLVALLPGHAQVLRVEVAGPGFINFFVAKDYLHQALLKLLNAPEAYGRDGAARPERILLEFVSSNPTGPLHIGHGRCAVYGDSLARLLRFVGHKVDTEYYVNDAGRQVDILGLSVCWRRLQLDGLTAELPAGAYQGEYLIDTASALDASAWPPAARWRQWQASYAPELGDDAALDQLLSGLRELLGMGFAELKRQVVAAMVAIMRAELERLGVQYQRWFSELSLYAGDALVELERGLQEQGHIYQQDGASWLRTSAFGDEKDRVVRRANGSPTYLASDIGYHYDKLQRPQDYQRLLNVWGADHHGYIDRLKAVLAAFGADPNKLEVPLVQMAYLRRSGARVSMSTRRATFYPLQSLMDELSVDALRFFYLLSGHNHDLELDVDLALQQSKQNPVYYVQYAHARIVQLRAQIDAWPEPELASLQALQHPLELKVLEVIHQFPELVTRAAGARAPHLLTGYSRELAAAFHSFYNELKVLGAEPATRTSRLLLARGCQLVLRSCAQLLGISLPQRM